MNPFEIETALKTFTILIDTREQPTERFKRRIDSMGVPTRREKLDFGDYSASVILPGGTEYSLKNKICIERKMNFSELCSCFCQERERFRNEFERAEKAGAKMYLLIESATWEKAYKGEYRSRMNARAFVASTITWMARYNCQVIMCQPMTTGKLIKDILYREMKERLEKC